jgi:hypothetical protein
MGPDPLIFDHNLTLELWNDPLFWEQVPACEVFREKAEEIAAKADAEQSSLSLKASNVYNLWIKVLRKWYERSPDKVRQVTDYIHKKRQHRQEAIILPPDKKYREPLLLSDGVN